MGDPNLVPDDVVRALAELQKQVTLLAAALRPLAGSPAPALTLVRGGRVASEGE